MKLQSMVEINSICWSRPFRASLIALAVGVVMVTGVAFAKHDGASGSTEVITKQITARVGGRACAEATAPAPQIQTALITIRPTGFDPSEIGVAEGHFRIAVDNKSGLDEVTLRLTREGGDRVREVRLPPGQLKWRETLMLPPGNYLLTEANHSDWRCRITVAP